MLWWTYSIFHCTPRSYSDVVLLLTKPFGDLNTVFSTHCVFTNVVWKIILWTLCPLPASRYFKFWFLIFLDLLLIDLEYNWLILLCIAYGAINIFIIIIIYLFLSVLYFKVLIIFTFVSRFHSCHLYKVPYCLLINMFLLWNHVH